RLVLRDQPFVATLLDLGPGIHSMKRQATGDVDVVTVSDDVLERVASVRKRLAPQIAHQQSLHIQRKLQRRACRVCGGRLRSLRSSWLPGLGSNQRPPD